MSNENEGADESGWDLEPGDESAPLAEAVGRLVKLCREQAGLRVAEFAQIMGYGEDMIRKIERGARIPRVEFLDRADDVLNVGGHLRAFMEDMERARYPKKVRELKELEDRAVSGRMARQAVFQREPAVELRSAGQWCSTSATPKPPRPPLHSHPHHLDRVHLVRFRQLITRSSN